MHTEDLKHYQLEYLSVIIIKKYLYDVGKQWTSVGLEPVFTYNQVDMMIWHSKGFVCLFICLFLGRFFCLLFGSSIPVCSDKNAIYYIIHFPI